MSDTFIRKLRPSQDGLDFDSLRKEGIRLSQEISGDVWTDYNLHDPGVTLLEAYCYALTDVINRTRFEAADYLASEDGTIDFERQVLVRPDEIFPSRPVTANDFRKLILVSVPNVDNVWIAPDPAQPPGQEGLSRVYVQLGEAVRDQKNEGVQKAYAGVIEKVYAANRNLCEDLGGVEIVERIPYTLSGEIEIDGRREPAAILAEIYFECAQYLCPKVPIHSHAEMLKQGKGLEELLTGVAADGYIADDELYPWSGQFSASDLSARIARVAGVKNINQLNFVDASGVETDNINLGHDRAHRTVASLRFPEPDAMGGIRFFKGGKAYPVLQRDVEPELGRLDYKHRVQRQQKRRFDWVQAMLPSAAFRNLKEYYSFQNHLPAVYGLNAYGVPDSAPPERKAQAAQLKAYLLFSEQVMANFLQTLQQIPRMFSLDEHLEATYFPQALGNDAVPNVERLYLEGVDSMDEKLARLAAGFDNFGDRRNRILDYLLALYGERFNQHSLRHFFPEGANVEQELIGNKIAYLRDIVDTGRNRSAAFDWRRPAGEGNVPGLKRKLKLLLGMSVDEDAALSAAGDFHIVEHILLRPGAQAASWPATPGDFYAFRLSVFFPADAARFAVGEFRKLVLETLRLNCPAHVCPEAFWLSQAEMEGFNALHEGWLAERRATGAAGAAAKQMLLFLLDARKPRK